VVSDWHCVSFVHLPQVLVAAAPQISPASPFVLLQSALVLWQLPGEQPFWKQMSPAP
jgi:hypothetical protein